MKKMDRSHDTRLTANKELVKEIFIIKDTGN